jgi:hypothetical protein
MTVLLCRTHGFQEAYKSPCHDAPAHLDNPANSDIHDFIEPIDRVGLAGI